MSASILQGCEATDQRSRSDRPKVANGSASLILTSCPLQGLKGREATDQRSLRLDVFTV
jgi:hypothetical protein